MTNIHISFPNKFNIFFTYHKTNMDSTNIKQIIEQTLKSDDRLWDTDKTELNQTLLLDLIEKIDEKVIDLLLQQQELRDKFFVKIKDVYVFKTNDFRFFMEENKIDNSYTKYKNKIWLTDWRKFLKDTNDVVLDFPFKDCVLEWWQSNEEWTDTYFEKNDKLWIINYELKKSKRKEIFFNQVLAHDEIDRLFDQKALINWKRFTQQECSEKKCSEQELCQQGVATPCEIRRDKDWTIKENLIIKGNNLLALHSLKKQFAGEIKLIYIDPPYNTGNDGFKYNDSFNHSTWLTFMKNRLEVARELLRDDGVIFVQCDENEQAYLKVLMDSIYWRNNFISNICVFTQASQNWEGVIIQKNTESILCYSYNIWRVSINKVDKASDNLRVLDDSPSSLETRPDMWYTIYRNEKENDIITKMDYNKKFIYKNQYEEVYIDDKELLEKWYIAIRPRIKDGKIHRRRWWYETFNQRKDEIIIKNTNWLFLPYFRQSWYLPPRNIIEAWVWTKHLNQMFQEKIFDYPKPENLIKRIIEIWSQKWDIVLDYHLWSATTCAVAHKMGRQYIGIEQMDYIETISVERLKKVIWKSKTRKLTDEEKQKLQEIQKKLENKSE